MTGSRLLGIRRPPTGERGFTAVLAAILVPVVFGLCALTIDVGHWYVVAQSLQNAADAAALGGVAYLPGDVSSAEQQAVATAAENGFSANVAVGLVPDEPTELQVTVTLVVQNTLGQFLGMPSETITRTAVAITSNRNADDRRIVVMLRGTGRAARIRRRGAARVGRSTSASRRKEPMSRFSRFRVRPSRPATTSRSRVRPHLARSMSSGRTKR